jgi:hypothetical protein
VTIYLAVCIGTIICQRDQYPIYPINSQALVARPDGPKILNAFFGSLQGFLDSAIVFNFAISIASFVLFIQARKANTTVTELEVLLCQFLSVFVGLPTLLLFIITPTHGCRRHFYRWTAFVLLVVVAAT